MIRRRVPRGLLLLGCGPAVAFVPVTVGVAFAVPESPAFSYLGTSPSRISRPATAWDLGVQLVQGVDSTGAAINGLAIEATPWFLFPSGSVTLEDYQRSALRRSWSNLRVSLATAQAAGLDAATDLAVGFHLPLVDRGDPLRDGAFTTGVRGSIPLPQRFNPPPAVARRDSAERSEAYGKYWDQYVADHRGAFRLTAACATGLRLVDSRFHRAYGTGAAAWLDGSGRLAPWLDVTGHLEWRERRAIPGQAYRRTLTAGVRLDLSGRRANLFSEWLPRRVHPKPAEARDNAGHWSAGVEFKLADHLWAATGLGSGYGLEKGADRVVVIANVRWAISTKSRLLE